MNEKLILLERNCEHVGQEKSSYLPWRLHSSIIFGYSAQARYHPQSITSDEDGQQRTV